MQSIYFIPIEKFGAQQTFFALLSSSERVVVEAYVPAGHWFTGSTEKQTFVLPFSMTIVYGTGSKSKNYH